MNNNTEILTLLNATQVKKGRGGVNPRFVAAFNSEIAMYGYTFDKAVLEALETLTQKNFSAFRKEFLEEISEVSGSNHQYITLFNKFPYKTPDQEEYLLKRILGQLNNDLKINIENAKVLSCGHIIDLDVFAEEDFGVCPICQHQVDELSGSESKKYDFKSITPLKKIDLATDHFISKAVNDIVTRQSSISMDERKLVLSLKDKINIKDANKVFNENIPLLYVTAGETAVKKHIKSATDILRIATLLGNYEADLSLKENPRFKVKTSDKKALMRLLEDTGNLEEDMVRHRESWLRLGEKLNPGSAENKRKFPKTAQAFDTLRNNKKSIQTFGKIVEEKIRKKKIDKTLMSLLAKRPGEFMRRIDVMLRNHEMSTKNAPKLNRTFKKYLIEACKNAKTKMLFDISKYLSHRRTVSDVRSFIPKGMVNKIQIVDDKRKIIPDHIIGETLSIIDEELSSRFSKLEPMGKIYIDPNLSKMIIPYNRRGDSSTTTPITKGSRYKLKNEKTPCIRLFQYWVGDIDLDLSVILYDKNFNFVQQVSWTDLKGIGCHHSGDIQSAPDGGSEFIDINIDKVLKNNIRYAVMSVISYRGEQFSSFPAFAGFMERDSITSGKKYEPEAVSLKFDVNSNATSHMPLVFDLKERDIIFADISCGNSKYAAVEGQVKKYSTLLKGVINMIHCKPTVFDVLIKHALARGELIENPKDADKVYTVDDFDIEEILNLMD